MANLVDFDLPITDTFNEAVLTEVIETFICPSDPDSTILDFGQQVSGPVGGGSSSRNFQQSSGGLNLARSNYSGVFGNLEVESDPFRGIGVFFGNSEISFQQISDGSSNTIIIGERRNDLGAVTWLGVIPGIEEPFARVVGATDRSPNGPGDEFEDFRSYHPGGINVALGDGSTQFINDSITETIFEALGTRAGGEVANF